jgi:hypothetical protein
MILDNELLVADDLAHGGTVTAINLGTAKPGPGERIRMFAIGNGSLAGATGLAITDCDTSGGSYEAVMSLTCTAAELNSGIYFELPTHVRQYVKVDLSGTTSAGAWTCGVIMPGSQTNL